MLGRAQRISARRVHHDDAVPCGRVLIDVIRAHPRAYDRLQPTISLECTGRNLHSAAANGAIELREHLAQSVALQPGAHLMLDPRRAGEHFKTFWSKRIKNNYAGHGAGCLMLD